MLRFTLSILGIFLICVTKSYEKHIGLHKDKCGYKSCTKPKEGYINVHIAAHSHDDVGWLKTIDQYYYGSKASTQEAGVQYIIDSVVSSLERDPKRKFIYVETAFFWKWWLKQNHDTQKLVKSLVNEGRLEFIGGGWSMHDEAATHYHSIVDQMSWGFRKLEEAFGECGRPKIGWQIDPFGHSRESASLMARFGFDGLLLGRLDIQEKDQRFTNLTGEMVWEASASLGDKADIFTSILYDLYVAPKNFCFDILCNDDPIIDDKESPDYNADEKAALFIDVVNKMTKVYKTSNLLVTMGMDFNFQGANKNFVNIDRVIEAVNSLQSNSSNNINLFYSSPSCYIKALNDEGISWPTKSDDFFPYASAAHAYWTGYFTSRPALKRYERMGNNFLQICKQLYTLTNTDDSEVSKLNTMREAMGVMQHHDAITGTEKQHVAFDYARLLDIGFTSCGKIVDAALRTMISKDKTTKPVAKPSDLKLKSCMLLNISSCSITETFNTFVVTLYNPLSRVVSQNVRLPVSGDGKDFIVYDPAGNKQTVQVVPIPSSVKNIPGRSSTANVEVIFIAKDLPALGYKSFYVTKDNNSSSNAKNIQEDEYLHKLNDIAIDQSFWWYESYPGSNIDEDHRASGAYAFRPNGDPTNINKSPTSENYTGPIVDEIHQVFSDWVSQVIRKYKGSNIIEYHWLIGPIPIEDGKGKEIITRYSTKSIKSNKVFYTDSNGREMLTRIRDYRPSYTLDLKEPVSGNYYPVSTRIMIKDSKNQMSVITDRSHGGSSIHDGEIELMLHRRILRDDGFGVGEALNENAFGEGLVVRGTHYITTGDPNSQSASDRVLVQEQVLSPWLFFTPTNKTFTEWKEKYNMEYSGLEDALPTNVQITTLEPWLDGKFLIRLEHIMEENDDSKWSKPVTVNLKNMFSPFEMKSVKESTLGGNLLLSKMKRLKWKKESSHSIHADNEDDDGVELSEIQSSKVKLSPMEIRSFIVKLDF